MLRMSAPARCDECRAIGEEFRKAARDRATSPERARELRAHFSALQSLQAGTGERVDELLERFPFRSQQDGPVRPPESWYSEAGNPAILAAVRKMLEHQARTGHKVMELLFLK